MRFGSRDLEALFSLTTLPSAPEALPRLWRAHEIGDEGALAAAVDADPRLAMDLVRLVNELEGRRVDTTRAAVSLLGVTPAVNFSLTLLVRRELLSWARRDSRFDRIAYWRHSVGAAAAAFSLADFVPGVSPVEAYAAGLLHDVGLLAIDLVAPRFLNWNDQEAVSEEWVDADFEQVHSRLGRAVSNRWNLPQRVAEAVSFHHAPHAAPDGAISLASAVCVADSLVAAADPYLSGAPDTVVKRSLDRLGLSRDRANSLCRAAAAGIDQAEGVVRFARPG